MRTSRIAADTTKLVTARASKLATPRSRSATNRVTAPSHSDDAIASEAPGASDDAAKDSVISRTLKRKRGESEPGSSPIRHIKEEAGSTRTSPRKSGTSSNGMPKKARRQPAKRIVGNNGEVKFEPPPGWEDIYKTTHDMRKLWQAPVDTMGCESLAEDHRSPKDRRLQTLVALMLSSQTKDTVTAVAMENLQRRLPGGFTLESVLAVEPAGLNTLINKVGFHNNKTKYIKQTAQILKNEYSSDIPDTIEGLVSLPGVGPKMAYLCMSAAWGRDEGIGVDVHVHRITNLWGWHKTSTPEETRAALESWLPREKWHDINHLLVGFGQTWCPPVGRKCDQCKLAEKGLCPSASVDKKVKTRVKKERVIAEVDREDHTINEEVDLKMDVGTVKAEDLQIPSGDSITESIRDIEDVVGIHRRSRRLAS